MSEPNVSNVLDGKTDSGFENVQSEVSEPAQNTRSQNDMTSDAKPVSQTARDGDEIETYEGRQGTASMDKEKVREMGRKGGSLPADKGEDGTSPDSQ